MTSPNADNEPTGQRRADVPRQDDGQASDSQNLDPARYDFAETALGGADSVQKTSYVTGAGTEPEGAPRANVSARTPTGGGINVAAWVIGLVAALIALVYAFGVFR